MLSERLRNREVYADRPAKTARIIIDKLTKELVMCIEAMVRDGICTQREAEEIVLTSMEKTERRIHALSEAGFNDYLDVEIAKADLARELMEAGAMK